MTLDNTSIRRLRAKQVGMLMQAYRRAYQAEGRSSRLSQEGLLRLMGQVDPKYSDRYDHSTVARWESGATRPTRDRLEVFGNALSLSPPEIDGLIGLAGLLEPTEPAVFKESARLPDSPSGNSEASPLAEPEDKSTHFSRSYTGEVIRYFLSRFAFPGLFVAGTGFILASLGWHAAWMMMLYLIVATSLVLAQGFLRLRRSDDLRELFFVCVFFLLSANLLQVPIIRMDPFGFYALANFANTPMPYLLGVVVNLMLALVAGLLFDFLWRWQYTSDRGAKNPSHRAALVAFPPLLCVYAVSVIFCSVGAWIFFLFVFSITGTIFAGLLIMRDADVKFNPWDRRLMLQAAVALTLILMMFSGGAIFTLYWEPSLMVLPDHTLIRSWEIDFNALGYPPGELVERYRIGAVWSCLATLIFMVIVLGGKLIVTIYKLDGGESPGMVDGTAAAVATAPAGGRTRRRSGLSLNLWPRRLPGLSMLSRLSQLARFHASPSSNRRE